MEQIHRKFRAGFVAFSILLGQGVNSFAEERSHLADLVRELKNPQKITELYREVSARDFSSKQDKKRPAKASKERQVADLLKKHRKVKEKFLKSFRESSPFVRGEIEDTQTLNSLISLLQLSILEIRWSFAKSDWGAAQKEAGAWFNFAADLAYEEATNVGLKTSAVIRSFILDELEDLMKSRGTEVAKSSQLREWLTKVRAPWPIDRVIVSESKRALAPVLLGTVDKVAKSLQQSPYQTAAEALDKIPGEKPKDLNYLKELWKTDDIGRMKEEITRIGKLKLRMAALEYEYQHKKPAARAEDLVSEKLLDRVPIDYNTGKPMELGGL